MNRVLVGVVFQFFMGLVVGGGLCTVNSSYYHLVEYTVGLASFIAVWVLIVVFCQVFYHKGLGAMEGESNAVEFLWTFFPTILVFLLSLFNVGCFSPDLTSFGFSGVKVVGRQWYWSYGLSGADCDMYDSVMGDFVDSVDKPLRLNYGDGYCLYVTSSDVIHSFSVPFLSVKVDAMPGRINQFSLTPDYCGRHVGYCSELCGAGHAYMPIVVEVLPVA